MKNPFVKYVFIDPLKDYDRKPICTVKVIIDDNYFSIPLFILDKVIVCGKKWLLLSIKNLYDTNSSEISILDIHLDIVQKTVNKSVYDLSEIIQPDQWEFLEHFVRLRYKNQLFLEAKKLEEEAMNIQEKIRKI